MNQPDDQYLDLGLRLADAIGPEPPMMSGPADDLARGRRLVRRRWVRTVSTVSMVAPALLAGGWALSGVLSALPPSPAEYPQSASSPGPTGPSIARSSDSDVHRVAAAIVRHLDPSRTHTHAGLSSSQRSATAEITSVSVDETWTDGHGTGVVLVTVRRATGVRRSDTLAHLCTDPSITAGPVLTCTTRSLPDGTAIQIGQGGTAGVERITVRYVREDSTIVWATADAASEQWWRNGTGDAPLTAPPASVGQLIALVRDPAMRLQ